MGCTWYILCTYLQLFSSLFTSALAYFVGQIVKNKGFQKIYTDMGGIWMIYGIWIVRANGNSIHEGDTFRRWIVTVMMFQQNSL